MAFKLNIKNQIRFFAEYFHASSLTSPINVFSNSAGSVIMPPSGGGNPEDVTETKIKPLKQLDVLKSDGDNILIPLRGLLVTPGTDGPEKYPLVIIVHGAHAYTYDDVLHDLDDSNWLYSYEGYEAFQDSLAKNGIASFSVDLLVTNVLGNNETESFDIAALDFNQRILHIFLYLKLLRTIANEPVEGDEFPIKFLEGSTLKTLQEVLATLDPSSEPGLNDLRNKLLKRIDFSKLGFMGHSRGADAVSRVFAYFYKSGVLENRTFKVHMEVDRRITILSEQMGKPPQTAIKSILALQPTAIKNEAPRPNHVNEAAHHGYVIDNAQTMFFLGVGTHDEDVSFDAVRMYEYPVCPKAMISINGASHYRFNTVWGDDIKNRPKEFGEDDSVKLRTTANLMKLDQHTTVLREVFGKCFTSTLTGNQFHLLYFTKEKEFDFEPVKHLGIQLAWKFPFPFEGTNNMINVSSRITSPTEKPLEESEFKFEQEIPAFYLEKDNAGTFTIQIPINTATGEFVPALGQFNFRFAKGFDLTSRPDRIEEKNFSVQLFDNETPIGKTIYGRDIETIVLKALEAFDEKVHTDSAGNVLNNFEYSILLQTVDIPFKDFIKSGQISELLLVNKIEINIIPDRTKLPPDSPSTVAGGMIGGAVVGAALGALGALILLSQVSEEEKQHANKYTAIAAGAGALIGTIGMAIYFVKTSEKDAFAFTDFLLTNRQIPIMATPS